MGERTFLIFWIGFVALKLTINNSSQLRQFTVININEKSDLISVYRSELDKRNEYLSKNILIFNKNYNKWEPIKPCWWRSVLPRSRDKTDPCPTGSDTKPITTSGTTPREDTGEEPNLKSIEHIPRSITCMILFKLS